MVELAIMTVYLFILGIGGIVADYIFPNIKPINDYVNKLIEEKERNRSK